MKNLSKNRLILAVICIGVGLVLCFVIAPLYTNATNGKTIIIKSTVSIPQGTLITENMLIQAEVGAFNLPTTVYKNKEDVVGQYTTTAIYKDDYFLPEKIAKQPPINSSDSYLELLEDNERAVSFSIKSLATGLADKVKAGDIVSLVALKELSESAIIPEELQYVEVIAVTTASGQDMGSNNEQVSTSVAAVTVKGSVTQAQKIAELEKYNSLHIILVSRNNKEKADELLKQQQDILENPTKQAVVEGEKINEEIDINNRKSE